MRNEKIDDPQASFHLHPSHKALYALQPHTMTKSVKWSTYAYTTVLCLLSLASATEWIQYPANGFATMTHYTMPNNFVASCGCTADSRQVLCFKLNLFCPNFYPANFLQLQ